MKVIINDPWWLVNSLAVSRRHVYPLDLKIHISRRSTSMVIPEASSTDSITAKHAEPKQFSSVQQAGGRVWRSASACLFLARNLRLSSAQRPRKREAVAVWNLLKRCGSAVGATLQRCIPAWESGRKQSRTAGYGSTVDAKVFSRAANMDGKEKSTREMPDACLLRANDSRSGGCRGGHTRASRFPVRLGGHMRTLPLARVAAGTGAARHVEARVGLRDGAWGDDGGGCERQLDHVAASEQEWHSRQGESQAMQK